MSAQTLTSAKKREETQSQSKKKRFTSGNCIQNFEKINGKVFYVPTVHYTLLYVHRQAYYMWCTHTCKQTYIHIHTHTYDVLSVCVCVSVWMHIYECITCAC